MRRKSSNLIHLIQSHPIKLFFYYSLYSDEKNSQPFPTLFKFKEKNWNRLWSFFFVLFSCSLKNSKSKSKLKAENEKEKEEKNCSEKKKWKESKSWKEKKIKN